jgi:pimeloyl-ACP methyl ester carboxylesterase
MWRIGEHLAESGWRAIAVDQRGHGAAPRASRYRIEDYAGDLLGVPTDRPWDVAIGHSIGGANLVAASAMQPGFAQRIVLMDPALCADRDAREQIRANQLTNHDSLTVEKQRAVNPQWHDQDVELSVAAVHRASAFALEHSVTDNHDWDVLAETAALTVPTLVFQAGRAELARYLDEHADPIESANPLVSRTVIDGTGHNVHRDAPDEFCQRLSAWLESTP